MGKRVVITGIGLVTPLGSQVQDYWTALINGRSGIGPITVFDASDFSTRIGGEVRDVDFEQEIPREQRRRMSRASQLAVVAAKRALANSGLVINEANCESIDLFMGVATPCMETLAHNMIRRGKLGPKGSNPLMPAIAVSTAPAGNVAIMLGIKGETITISTGCSSSTNAIGQAFRRIRLGQGTVAFAGGADVGVQADLIAAYGNSNSLSKRNDCPQAASRPFDAGRDGQVLSEAAGILVLEDYEHARHRQAPIFAELSGYGTTTDSESMTAVSVDETQAAKCLAKTVADAGWASEPDYYCAHGSSNKLTDCRETRSLKRVFKRDAYRLPVSSIKSMVGHPFGASGVLQAATCALALKHGELPPTINYDSPDPECDLDYIPNEARRDHIGRALAYSLGMGGNNAALALAGC